MTSSVTSTYTMCAVAASASACIYIIYYIMSAAAVVRFYLVISARPYVYTRFTVAVNLLEFEKCSCVIFFSSSRRNYNPHVTRVFSPPYIEKCASAASRCLSPAGRDIRLKSTTTRLQLCMYMMCTHIIVSGAVIFMNIFLLKKTLFISKYLCIDYYICDLYNRASYTNGEKILIESVICIRKM